MVYLEERQKKVRVQLPLVHLVNDDVGKVVGELAVSNQHHLQHTSRHEQEPTKCSIVGYISLNSLQ